MDRLQIESEAAEAITELSKDHSKINRYFESLSEKKGYSREDIYWIANRIATNEPQIASELIVDDVGEFLTGLLGHCADECIVKLCSDPSGMTDKQFAEYVRNNKWAKNPDTIWPGELWKQTWKQLISSTEQNDAGETE